jgi:hypothetical protein
MKTRKLTTHPNGVVLKSNNRRIAVIKEEKGIRISVLSLTKYTGKEKGAISELFQNDKIKYSAIGFSQEALEDLFYVLSKFLTIKPCT